MGELNCAYCKAEDCGRAGQNYPIDSSFECFVAITKADRIRSMTDEELAFYMQRHPCWINKDDYLDWLQSPADGGDGDES